MGERDLSAVQRFVTDAVRDVREIGKHPSLAVAADALVAPSARGMAPHERLEVYREQFWLRHLANLGEDFPTLIAVIGGREAFRELAIGYLRACPPRTWDLQRLGADLPGYLTSHPPWGDDPLARDAAHLDWAFMEAFDAPDSPPFDARVLASTPEEAWPAARIDLHASLRLLALGYPVHALREAVARGEAPARPAAAPTHLVVHRDPACFLARRRRGAARVRAARDAARREPPRRGVRGRGAEQRARSARDRRQARRWFQQWTQGGWIRGVRFEG